MSEAETDHGAVLKADAYGGTWHPQDGWTILMPDNLKPNKTLLHEDCALVAAVLRLENDPDFQDECIAWMNQRRQG